MLTQEEKKNKRQNLESIEKYFFAYILENPSYFHRVEPIGFKNQKIGYVYKRIYDYYMTADKAIVPSNNKILELIRFDDPDSETITNSYLKDLLTVDVGDMIQSTDDNFLVKALQSWTTANSMKNQLQQAVDWIRGVDEIDYEQTLEMADRLREAIVQSTITSFDDEDLGLDFFDHEAHIQDTAKNKISTGWSSIDELLNGGWDRKTLNIITGPSNSGKSLWLCNIAVNGANAGKNVLYVTLEMSDSLVMKRLGSAWLKIPVDDYDVKSRDSAYMQKQLKRLKASNAMIGSNDGSDDLFNNPIGNLFVKEFASGTCTVADIENHVKNLEDKKGIKIDMVVVDYLTIMQPDSKGRDNLFMNGKLLSNGLRAIAQTRDLVMVSAMQVGKDNYNSVDITLADISESKAIIENADTIFGIIRSDNMRAENKYHLKLLKLRGGSFKWERTQFDLDPNYLTMVRDKKIELA